MGQRLDWLQQAIGYQEDTGKTLYSTTIPLMILFEVLYSRYIRYTEKIVFLVARCRQNIKTEVYYCL